jgi:MerR family transcriptional regulator, heat shock protein HspR
MAPWSEVLVSAEELARAAGIGLSTFERLVRLGFVEPAPGGSAFTAATAARLKRMLRLHDDLGIDLFAAVIIVDLVERMEDLDAELSRLRAGR